MATDAGELIVKISADVTDIKSQLSQLSGNLSGIGAKAVATGSIMADAFEKVAQATFDFVKESILAFAEHEQAMTRLNVLVGHDAAEAMDQFAQAMQRTTTFSDDQVLALEKQLSQYGVYPGSVKTATTALLDFAAVTGVDLPEAGSMLARAMSGQSRELKQYGLDLSTTSTRSENLEKTTSFLEDRFKGAAQTIRGTTIGSIESLTNRFDDLKKRIGEDLLPVTKKFLDWASEALSDVERLVNIHKKYSETLEDQKKKLADLNDQHKAQISNGAQLTAAQQQETKALIAHIKELEVQKVKVNDVTGATNREIASVRALQDEIEKLEQEQSNLEKISALTTQKRILTAQMELAQMIADQQQLTTITEIETNKRLEQSRMSWEANASYSDQLRVSISQDLNATRSDWVNMTNTMMQSFANSTAQMIVQGGRFSDVIKKLWKQIAEAVIAQIIRMIAEWMVWMALTGGWGGGLGGFMAEGGMINEPSLITGLRSGKTHMAGEAGPEMVVPSSGGTGSSNVAADTAGMSSKGGNAAPNITIHISGQFMEATPAKWQEMVRQTIIPELRRSSMVNPNGPVKRVRGAI